PQFLDACRPARRDSLAQATQHNLRCLLIQMHVATGGQERKSLPHSVFDVAPRSTDQRAIAPVKAEFATMGADEVEDSAKSLARGSTQTAPKLLEKQRRALGGTQHEHGIDSGHV